MRSLSQRRGGLKLFTLVSRIEQHQKPSDAEPKYHQIEVKLRYLFECYPRASAQGLAVVLVVRFGVPVLFIISFSVHMVVFVYFAFWIISCGVVVVLCSVFFIQIFPPFFTVQSGAGLVIVSMRLVCFQKITVVFVISQSVAHLLLLSVVVTRPALWRLFII